MGEQKALLLVQAGWADQGNGFSSHCRAIQAENLLHRIPQTFRADLVEIIYVLDFYTAIL